MNKFVIPNITTYCHKHLWARYKLEKVQKRANYKYLYKIYIHTTVTVVHAEKYTGASLTSLIENGNILGIKQ